MSAMPPPTDEDLVAGVSVVVPSFQGVAYLGGCLDSLAAQTMDPDLFEVIVVLNGTPDGSRQLVADHAAAHPRITWRIVELLDHPGAGRARNAGIALARRTFTTLVDDDDRVTPNYLEALYAHAEWDVVPMAWLDDVTMNGEVDANTRFNRTLATVAGQTVSADLVPHLLLYNGCKLLPTSLVRRVSHDTELRSGIDVEFMTRVYAAGRFRMHTLRRDEGAIYLRTLRPGSISRQAYTFDFSIERRLDVIQRVSPDAVSRHPDVRDVARRHDQRPGRLHAPLPAAPHPATADASSTPSTKRDLPWFAWHVLDQPNPHVDDLTKDPNAVRRRRSDRRSRGRRVGGGAEL